MWDSMTILHILFVVFCKILINTLHIMAKSFVIVDFSTLLFQAQLNGDIDHNNKKQTHRLSQWYIPKEDISIGAIKRLSRIISLISLLSLCNTRSFYHSSSSLHDSVLMYLRTVVWWSRLNISFFFFLLNQVQHCFWCWNTWTLLYSRKLIPSWKRPISYLKQALLNDSILNSDIISCFVQQKCKWSNLIYLFFKA